MSDRNYPGRGAISCYNCGRPAIEHPLTESCPFEQIDYGGKGLDVPMTQFGKRSPRTATARSRST